MRKIRYIIIEDNPNDAFLIERQFKKAGYSGEMEVVTSRAEFASILQENNWDFVVADYQLPEYNALEAIETFKEFEDIDIPFIVVSGTIGEERAVELIKKGAHDCLNKNNLMRLVPVVERELKDAENRREKRATEEKFLQSEERYRLLAETSPLGVLLFSDGYLDYINESAQNLLFAISTSLKPKESLADLLEKSTFFSRIKTCFPLQSTIQKNEVFEGKGEEVYLNLILSPVKNKENCFQILIQDTTADQKNLHEIKKLSKALEFSPVAVTIMNKKGTIEYVNQQFEFITGYSMKEAVGQSYNITKIEGEKAPLDENFGESIDVGNLWIGEVRNRKKNGELYWASEMISSVLGKDGEVVNYVSIAMDVTQKKAMKDELLSAKLRAEESDRLKSAFLANMSHEIRTPLNSIIGFSSLLSVSDNSKEKQASFIMQINNSSQELLSIITNIIEVSKFESNMVETKMGFLYLNEIMDELYILFEGIRKKIGKNKLILEKIVADEDLMFGMLTDREKLFRLVYCLLDNSMKFTKEGFVRYGYRIKKERVCIFVEDSGIGIPDHMHEIIFQRFRQVEDSSVREFGGPGLGLTLSQKIAEILGGNIRLESELNKGSIFYLELPIRQ